MSLARNDRVLLVRVLRWARANGWEPGPYFHQWRTTDRRSQVEWDARDSELSVYHNVDGYAVRWALVRIESVQRMVDVLAALSIVPSRFAMVYEDGYSAGTYEATLRLHVPLRVSTSEIAA